MKKILTTIVGAVFLSGCSSLSQKQDQTPAQGQNGIQSQTKANSFEMRLKEAQKPFYLLKSRQNESKRRDGNRLS